MKKRMLLALALVFAVLCMACANDADDGVDGAEGVSGDQSVSVAETGTDASADSTPSTGETSGESTSSADGTSGETSAESGTAGTDGTDMNTSSNPSESRDTNSETSSDTSKADETSTGTESSGTGSDTSTSSKPAENSESSKPAEGSENGGSVDTSGNTDNPSQTAHTHKYATTIINPTCTEDGYTLHTCSCGDSYKDDEVPATGHEMGYWSIRTVKESTYTEKGIHERQCNHCGEWMVDEGYDSLWAPPVNDEEEVYRRIMALQEVYPDWSVWDGDTYYDYRYDAWGNPIEGEPAFGYGSDDACQGFANMVSNTAFGLYWGHRTLPKGTFTIKDVRVGDLVYETGHVSVVLEVFDDHISTVGGNGGGKVYWYGYMDREYLESSCYIETRYDPVCF